MSPVVPYIDLKQQLVNGEVCAFVGAGLSVGAGLPGWYDLISQLSRTLDLVQEQLYEEERTEWAAERETIASRMSEIERKLGS